MFQCREHAPLKQIKRLDNSLICNLPFTFACGLMLSGEQDPLAIVEDQDPTVLPSNQCREEVTLVMELYLSAIHADAQ